MIQRDKKQYDTFNTFMFTHDSWDYKSIRKTWKMYIKS